MKKLLPILTLLFILIATPVLASSDKNRDENCNDHDNHGQFVSCVAHLHNGGSTVASAAHSDIGKKDHDEDRDDREDEDIDEDDDISASPTPGASPTVSPTPDVSPSPGISPSPIVSPTPDISPSPEVSPTPIVSPTPNPTGEQNGILHSIIEKLNEIIDRLNNLLK